MSQAAEVLVAAAQGSDSALSVLAGSGTHARRSGEVTPDQQFERIADRIARIPDPALRAPLPWSCSGRPGQHALLPLMQDGARGIQELLRNQARELGG